MFDNLEALRYAKERAALFPRVSFKKQHPLHKESHLMPYT